MNFVGEDHLSRKRKRLRVRACVDGAEGTWEHVGAVSTNCHKLEKIEWSLQLNEGTKPLRNDLSQHAAHFRDKWGDVVRLKHFNQRRDASVALTTVSTANIFEDFCICRDNGYRLQGKRGKWTKLSFYSSHIVLNRRYTVFSIFFKKEEYDF